MLPAGFPRAGLGSAAADQGVAGDPRRTRTKGSVPETIVLQWKKRAGSGDGWEITMEKWLNSTVGRIVLAVILARVLVLAWEMLWKALG